MPIIVKGWRICSVFAVWLALANFLAYTVVYVFCGGDAVQGRKIDGRYWLGNGHHYTEVDAAFFQLSKLLTYSLPITIIGGGVCGRLWKCKPPPERTLVE